MARQHTPRIYNYSYSTCPCTHKLMEPSSKHGEKCSEEISQWLCMSFWTDSALSMMQAMFINSRSIWKCKLFHSVYIFSASEYQANCYRLHKILITQISFPTAVHTLDIMALDIVGPVTKPELTIALLCKNDKAHNSTTEQKWYPSHTRKQSCSSTV